MDCFAMETLPPNYKFKSALRLRAAKLAVKFPLTVSKSHFSFLRGPFTAFQLPIYPTEKIKLDTKNEPVNTLPRTEMFYLKIPV